MKFTKEYINECIVPCDDYCNSNLEPHNGVLRVQIDPTKELDMIMDEVRKDGGYIPFFDDSGDYDSEGWYDFDAYCTKDELLEFVGTVGNSTEEDDFAEYTFDFDDETKRLFIKRLKEYFGEEWDEAFERRD